MFAPIAAAIFLLHLLMAAGHDHVTAKPAMTFPRNKFKGAVYEHAVILWGSTEVRKTRAEALIHMEKNLKVYRDQANEAKKMGADILVFPEDGLYGPMFTTRDSIYPYLEYIPDPRIIIWSPCIDPARYPDTEVQRELSCISKNNSMYMVANMGDKQPCDIHLDPHCPEDGRYQYNTDVAFGPDGTLLARYHKTHLFKESQFNAAAPEIVHFDTPFGRFGMLTCFDIIFYDPTVSMVLSSNISNIAFPTAWMDALPLFSGIGFHSSFPRRFGLNFLSSNIHLPLARFHGSGIYSPDGMKAFYYNSSLLSPGKLLVAELDVLDTPKPFLGDNLETTAATETQLGVNSEGNQINDTFQSYLFHDEFTFRVLAKPSGTLSVCQKDVCCRLDYAIDLPAFGKELFAIGAFDGLHLYDGQYYLQICTLVNCADFTNRSSCGSDMRTSVTPFQKLNLEGRFTAGGFIYPQLILSDKNGELKLAEAEAWTYGKTSWGSALWTNNSFNETVLSAALFGRDYTRDNESSIINQNRWNQIFQFSTKNFNNMLNFTTLYDKAVSAVKKLFTAIWTSVFDCLKNDTI